MIKHQILVTNLQGNVSQLEGRIDNQILGVKGLRHQEIVHLCLLQLRVQLNVHIWIWQLFFFLLSFYQFELCLWKLTNSNTQVCLGWMALFLVKRPTMKVKGVVSLHHTYVISISRKNDTNCYIYATCKLNFTQSFF